MSSVLLWQLQHDRRSIVISDRVSLFRRCDSCPVQHHFFILSPTQFPDWSVLVARSVFPDLVFQSGFQIQTLVSDLLRWSMWFSSLAICNFSSPAIRGFLLRRSTVFLRNTKLRFFARWFVQFFLHCYSLPSKVISLSLSGTISISPTRFSFCPALRSGHVAALSSPSYLYHQFWFFGAFLFILVFLENFLGSLAEER